MRTSSGSCGHRFLVVALSENRAAGAIDHHRHADALDLSYVQIRQYLAAAERAMDLAIATFPMPPKVEVRRSYPQRHYRMARLRRGASQLITLDKKRDPRVPLAARPLDKPIVNKLNLRDDDLPEHAQSVDAKIGTGYNSAEFSSDRPGRQTGGLPTGREGIPRRRAERGRGSDPRGWEPGGRPAGRSRETRCVRRCRRRGSRDRKRDKAAVDRRADRGAGQDGHRGED